MCHREEGSNRCAGVWWAAAATGGRAADSRWEVGREPRRRLFRGIPPLVWNEMVEGYHSAGVAASYPFLSYRAFDYFRLVRKGSSILASKVR